VIAILNPFCSRPLNQAISSFAKQSPMLSVSFFPTCSEIDLRFQHIIAYAEYLPAGPKRSLSVFFNIFFIFYLFVMLPKVFILQ